MDTPKEDGGAAFPIPDQRDAMGNGIVQGSDGMSLRDFFAAASLTGCIAGEANESLPEYREIGVEAALLKDAKRRAEWCYRQADAMLRARKDIHHG